MTRSSSRRWRATTLPLLLALLVGCLGGVLSRPAAAADSTFVPRTYAVRQSVPVGSAPRGVALDARTGLLYTANASSNDVSVVDRTTGTVRATVPVGAFPVDVAVDGSRSTAYAVAMYGGSRALTVIDTATATVRRSVALPVQPAAVLVDEASGTVYVSGFGGVAVLDASGTLLRTLGVVAVGQGMALDAAHGRLYVADQTYSGRSSALVAVDLATGSETRRWTVGSYANSVARDPSTHRVYVASFGDQAVYEVAEDGDDVTALPVPGNPRGLALDPASSALYVTGTNDGQLSVLDTSTRTTVTRLFVGGGGSGVVVDPSGDAVYVTGGVLTLVSATPLAPPLSLQTAPDRTVSATGPSGAALTFPDPAWTGPAGTAVGCVPASGTTFPVGDTSVRCTATSPRGDTASSSFRVRVTDEPNTSWPAARDLAGSGAAEQRLLAPGQSRWYRVPVQPDSTVQVDLTDLPADYDLALFRDIGTAFSTVTSPRDLALLTAQAAPMRFSPMRYSPMRFSPMRFSPAVLEPGVDTSSLFDLAASGPGAAAPAALVPQAYLPDAFAPGGYDPARPVTQSLADSAFRPAGDAAAAQQAFSSAQTSSLLDVSAQDGLADEHLTASTWGASGAWYVRVTGRNGASSTARSFHLSVSVTGGACDTPLASRTDLVTAPAAPDSARTLFLMDSARLPGLTADEVRRFAARDDVQGAVVDAAALPRLRALNAQADAVTGCPYAKNLVASALRQVVDGYRGPAGVLRSVVLVGGDAVVPFFRYADGAGVADEDGYVPPVADGTSSQASLRRGTFLSQDAYGARSDLQVQGATVPLPDLAVGRLVETPDEVRATLMRFGAPVQPASALVTGYDFLTDSADQIADEWSAGLGGDSRVDRLLTEQDVPHETTTVAGSPDRRHSWTAADLSGALRSRSHQLVYLAGHFSAGAALAADHETVLTTHDLPPAADGLLAGAVVLSAGCHSGYGVVDGHALPGLTDSYDWAQAMGAQGASLVAGTGYQYGDTDFVEYSERLYAGVAAGLRAGTGPVAVGDALLRAKQRYLATVPVLTGVHQKALLEATLYGLPMSAIDLPGARSAAPVVQDATARPVTDGPGARLGLAAAEVVTSTSTAEHTRAATVASDAAPSGSFAAQALGPRFTWLTGPDGVVTAPHVPALPLEVRDVTVPGAVLRGVGFRGGDYTDQPGVVPLTGAPAAEFSAGHATFSSPTFFPRPLAIANTLGAVEGDGRTRLLVTPAQHRTDGPGTSTLRRYSSLDLQLLYSASTRPDAGGSTPALAAAPSLSAVSSSVTPAGAVFTARAVGDPSAGVQSVWVTWTAESGPAHGHWRSVDLVRDPTDSTRWTSAPLALQGQDPTEVRYVVQAVNGVGLVALDDDRGAGFRLGAAPGLDPVSTAERAPTRLALAAPPAQVGVGDLVPVTATLSGASAPAGHRVLLVLGSSRATATTGDDGTATARLRVVDAVGTVAAHASWSGDATSTGARSADASVQVLRRPSRLTLAAASVLTREDPGVVATLTAAGVPVLDKTVFLVVTDGLGRAVHRAAVRSGTTGAAPLGALTLPAGTYTATATFGSATTDAGDGRVVDASDDGLQAAGATVVFQVRKRVTRLALTAPATVLTGGDETVGVLLTGPDGAGLPGATVTVTTTTDSGPRSRVLTTDRDGRASLVLHPEEGAHTLVAAFAGTADLADAQAGPASVLVGTALGPLEAPLRDALSTVRLGSSVPVKLTLLGARGTLPDSAAAAITSSCAVRLVPLAPAGTKDTSEPQCLRWDSTGHQAVGQWSTKGLAPGTWTLEVRYASGLGPLVQKAQVLLR